MSRCVLVLVWLILSLGVMIVASGCSSSKSSSDSGLLEQNGIKNVGDLVLVVIELPESNGSYLITDKTTISRVYQLLNDAERTSGISKQIRPDTVTLARKNGSTLSFAFGLYNPGLTWKYRSRPFVEFVKTELVGSSRYLNKEQLPAFSISQIASIGSSEKRTVLPSGNVSNMQTVIDIVTAAYKPYSSVTQTSTWSEIANFCTNESPGIEVVLKKPIQFQTLIGWIGPEPPQGSTALNLVALTIDRLVIYQGENRDLCMAFHATEGKPGWYVTDRFEQSELRGQTPESVYRELAGDTQ